MVKRLPASGSWRRKAIAGLVVIALLPVLPVILLMAANEVVSVAEHILGLAWPWFLAIALLAGLYRLVLGRWR